MGINLTTVLAATAGTHASHTAVRLGAARLTYAELDALASRFAGALMNAGIAPGDRVALMAPNGLHWPVAYHGILRTGGVVVPVNPLSREREVEHCLADSGASLLVAAGPARGVAAAGCDAVGIRRPVTIAEHHGLEDLPDGLTAWDSGTPDVTQRAPGDIAVLLYTSGTTGRPKGAGLTHSNLLWNAKVFADSLGVGGDDVILGALPLFHSFGQSCVMNAGMLGGASIALVDRFDAEVALDLLDDLQVTIFAGVPTMLSAMLAAAQGRTVSLPLRTVVSGGASLPVEVLHEFEARFGCSIYEGYGLSECSPVVSFNTPARPARPGSVGTPLWGVDVVLRTADGDVAAPGEVGEVCVRGHCVMAGYWGNPAATAETIDAGGWLRTGDLGRTDDGYLYIVDRKKDMIIRGGLNVYPREVEEVLYEHPDITEAAVVGVPHATLGEEVAAAVALRSGATLEADEVSQWVRARLAPYKYPRHVVILAELPKGPTGKILKREVLPALADTVCGSLR